MTASLRLVPYRFSAQPTRMIAFLELLGLRPVITSPERTFAVLRGRTGGVAVHDSARSETGAVSGDTHLDFDTADLDACVAALTAAGLDVRAWDEAYGRSAAFDTPRGSVGINADNPDDYGFVTPAPAEPGPIDVTAVQFSDDFAADTALLAKLGFAPEGYGDEHWQALRGADGTIGLHQPYDR